MAVSTVKKINKLQIAKILINGTYKKILYKHILFYAAFTGHPKNIYMDLEINSKHIRRNWHRLLISSSAVDYNAGILNTSSKEVVTWSSIRWLGKTGAKHWLILNNPLYSVIYY